MFGAVAVLFLCSTFSEAASLPTVDLGYAIQQATLNVSPNSLECATSSLKQVLRIVLQLFEHSIRTTSGRPTSVRATSCTNR